MSDREIDLYIISSKDGLYYSIKTKVLNNILIVLTTQ